MKKIILILAAIFSLGTLLNAQVDRSKPPKAGPAPKIIIGTYEKFELANGLKVIVVEDHKLPKVTYELVFDYDPILEGANAGYVEFGGGLIGTGTNTRTKDQINDEVDFMGAQMNFSAGGAYGSCLKKHNSRFLEIMSDALINAKFTAEELEKLRTKAMSGLEAAKKDPSAISERVIRAMVFGKNHPYGESQTEGSVKNITLDMCNGFYKTYVRPNISYLAIVGDITVAEAKPLVEKYFGTWQRAEVPSNKYEMPKPPAGPVVAIVDRPASVQSVIKLSYPVDLKYGAPDGINARLANTVLGGGTFRLFNNLREKHAYTYGAYSSLNPDKLVGEFTATAEVRNAVSDSAIYQILYEMKRMRDEKVPESELSVIRNFSSGNFALSLEDRQTVANFALNLERYKLPKDYYETYLSRIAAVNADNVMEASKKYITPDNCYILVVGKAEEVAKNIAQFSAAKKVEYYDIDGNPYDPSKKVKALPAGVTAQSVIDKYIEAIGGKKNMSKMEDLVVTMSASVQGQSISIKQSAKAPNKMLVEISMGGMVMQKQVFDGTKGGAVAAGQSQELTGKDLEDMKNGAWFNPELDYAKIGIKTVLQGIETVKDKDAYKMEITFPNGTKESEYYDVQSGLRVKKISDEGTTEYADYREVKGVKFPYAIDQEMQGMTLKMNVTSIEVNSKLKDDIFKFGQ